MSQGIARVSLLVRDYDEAIAFYAGALGFRVAEDRPKGRGERWVVLEPPGPPGCSLLLARAKNGREVFSQLISRERQVRVMKHIGHKPQDSGHRAKDHAGPGWGFTW